MTPPAHSFAYLFERFPSFVQTFVYREAMEMTRQGMAPWLVSIRRREDAGDRAPPNAGDVFYLPEADTIRAEVDALIASGKLPVRISRAVAKWRKLPDSNRVFEAVWLAPQLRSRGIRHVHAHFGGLAARTAWLLRELHGLSYSFTGHANDIFCENDFPITNAMLVRHARLVVVESDYARRWMEARHPSASGKIVRVFNGLAVDGIAARAPDAVPTIISVGRFVEKKGFSVLIEACRLLRAEGLQFACAIFGGGPLEAELRAQIDAAELVSVVQLLGPQSQDQVRERLARAHIFALASVPERDGGSDNLPTVIAEAMLAGLPIVSTNVAGIPEMIEDGREGFLVAPGNPKALAAALRKLVEDPALAEQFGARARTAAVEKFAVVNTTSALKHLLVRRCRVHAPLAAREADPTLHRGLLARLFG